MHLRLRRATCDDDACNEHVDVCKHTRPHAHYCYYTINSYLYTQYLVNIIHVCILYTYTFVHIDTALNYCVCGSVH